MKTIRMLLLASCVALTGTTAVSAELILNGGLENWGALTNSPPQGAPTSWSVVGTAPTQVPGLVAGSTYAALLPANSGIGTSEISQMIPTADRISEFEFSFLFAASDPGTTSARSLHLQMLTYNGSTYPVPIAMIITRGSSAGVLSLKAYTGSAWLNVAADAFNASVYDPGENEFTTLNVYQVTISADFGAETPHYDVTFGPAGGFMTTLEDVNIFFNTPSEANGQTLANVKFAGTQSTGAYAVDNVSLIPEPGVVGLLGIGLIAVRAFRRRR